MRICGKSQRIYVAPAGRVVVRLRRRVRALSVSRVPRRPVARACARVRVAKSRRVRLPRLAAGAYRIRCARPRERPRPRAARGDPRRRAPAAAARRGRGPRADGRLLRGPGRQGPEARRQHAAADRPARRSSTPTSAARTPRRYFNASWIPVHDAPGMRKAPFQYPKTCGEFRRDAAEGKEFLYGRQFFQLLASARAYDNLWRVWGLNAQARRLRPAGAGPLRASARRRSATRTRSRARTRTATNGGSGQLPLGLVQGQDKDTGAYNGEVTISCAVVPRLDPRHAPTTTSASSPGAATRASTRRCSAATSRRPRRQIGETPNPGAARDRRRAVPVLRRPRPDERLRAARLPRRRLRHGDARAVAGRRVLPDPRRGRPGADAELVEPQPPARACSSAASSAATTRASRWRSPSRRTSARAPRSRSSSRSSSRSTSSSTRSRRRSSRARSTRKLAEEGAVLFHDKDLWDDSRNRRIPRQPGNGSCASCHGVYSPRYAHDTRFLPDPRLKGIEANITPIETIRTDPARTHLVNEQFKRAWNTSWWGYDDLNPRWTPEGQGRAGTTFERAAQRLRHRAAAAVGPEQVEQRAARLRGAAAVRRVGVGAVLPQRQRPDDPRRPAAGPSARRSGDAPADQARRGRHRPGLRPEPRRATT